MRIQCKSLLFLLLFFYNANSFAQKLFGGIEIGSKGVKITVLDIKNAKKGDFEIKEFWTENTGIAKGIAINGNLLEEDINNTCNVVVKNYNKLLSEHKIKENQIFLIASSGVGMAKNTDVLVTRIKELLNKDLDIINAETEARLLVKGGIPPNRYLNSFILDIGGGNTKGGLIEVFNQENFVFLPLDLNLGTVTLTEKIKKKAASDDFSKYFKETTNFNDSLQYYINKMYDTRSEAKSKKNIYMSGGAVWAFITLSKNDVVIENFHEFTLKDVKDFQYSIITDYAKYEKIAETNKDAARVLKTYSQKYLMSANNLLINSLESLENPEKKKIYFVKQGQIAWLLAYVVDTVKNSKTIY